VNVKLALSALDKGTSCAFLGETMLLELFVFASIVAGILLISGLLRSIPALTGLSAALFIILGAITFTQGIEIPSGKNTTETVIDANTTQITEQITYTSRTPSSDPVVHLIYLLYLFGGFSLFLVAVAQYRA
jgi:hypothetical protein